MRRLGGALILGVLLCACGAMPAAVSGHKHGSGGSTGGLTAPFTGLTSGGTGSTGSGSGTTGSGSGTFGSTGSGDSPDMTQIEASIKSDVVGTGPNQFHATSVTKVICDPPHGGWAPGNTFKCFAYNASNQGIGVVDNTIEPDTDGQYQWNETWVPTGTAGAPGSSEFTGTGTT